MSEPCKQCLEELLGRLEDRTYDGQTDYPDRDLLDEAAAVIRQLLQQKAELQRQVREDAARRVLDGEPGAAERYIEVLAANPL